MSRTCLACFAFALLVPGVPVVNGAPAQGLVAAVDGFDGPGMGTSVAGVGDLNGDGFDDVLVGLGEGYGKARIFSGQWLAQGTGPQLLWDWIGTNTAQFGTSVAGGGDVNADGLPDFVVGAPADDNGNLPSYDSGACDIFSGTGGRLWKMYAAAHHGNGFSVAIVGDVNGDGYAEVASGAVGYQVPPSNFTGWVRVYSGEWITRSAAGQPATTQAVLYKVNGLAGDDKMGLSLCAPGDIDGDGVPDFAAGSLRNYVRVFSGQTGAEILTLQATTGQWGRGLGRARDVNVDGIPDLAVGAPAAESGRGMLQVISGEWIRSTALGQPPASERVLVEAIGDPDDHLGFSVDGVGDVDHDGRPDLLVSGRGDWIQGGPGIVRLISGRTGERIHSWPGALGDDFGFDVAACGDVNADGRTDFVFGAPKHPGNGIDGTGHFEVITGYDAPFGESSCAGAGCPCGNDDAGAGCVSSRGVGARLDLSAGNASLEDDGLAFSLTRLPLGELALVFMGTSRSALPFGDGLRCVGGPLFRFQMGGTGSTGTLDLGPGIGGLAQTRFALPGQLMPGSTWSFQGWYRDLAGPCSGSFNFSNVVTVTFRP